MNNTLYSRQQTIMPTSLVQLYKMLYILNNLYNRTWSNLLIPTFKSLIMALVIFALYGTIQFSATEELALYIWCPMVFVVGSFIVILIPPVFASVHSMSVEVIGKRNERMTVQSFTGMEGAGSNSKYLARVILSCRPMRCMSASMYFFDNDTGLVVLNLIIQMTAYFLLAST